LIHFVLPSSILTNYKKHPPINRLLLLYIIRVINVLCVGIVVVCVKVIIVIEFTKQKLLLLSSLLLLRD